LEDCYQMSTAQRLEVSDQARHHALAYDADLVLNEFMLPALEEVRGRFEERMPMTVKSPNGKLKVNGLKLDIEDNPSGGVAPIVAREIEGVYRLDDIPFEDGDVALDVGAHVGVVSIYLAKKHPEITVHAFEPLPENYRRLLRNIQANGVENVVAHDVAMTGDGRPLTIVADPQSNSGGASAYVAEEAGEGVEVQSVTLAQALDEYEIDRCRLLKIDVEGAEYEVLGDPSVLDRFEYLCGEFHDNSRLRKQGNDAEALTVRVASKLGADKVRVRACEMAE